MDVIGFIRVSLGSSTVQIHGHLGNGRASTCLEAGFSSQVSDVLEECTVKEQPSVVCFFLGGEAKGHKANDIHKEMFPVYGKKCLSQKRGS
jgi:hypothetical protein